MKIEEIELMSFSQRLEYMGRLIPKLDDYQSNRGYEGCVYFINDDLIIKKFDTKKNYEILELVFEAYCEESNKFESMGYSIPKIFAWARVPKKKIVDGRSFDFYILEQRLPGKNMFIGKIDNIYESLNLQFSSKDFGHIILAPEKYVEEYKYIVKKYLETYIEMNRIIDTMSIREIEKFIETVYAVYLKGEYNVPDVHAKNVLYTNDSLNLIDNYMCRRKSLVLLNKYTAYEFILSRIIILFRQNNYIGELKKNYFNGSITSAISSAQIEEMINENMSLCASSLKKMVLAMQKCCEHSESLTKQDYSRAYTQLVKHLDDQRAREVLSSFEICKY